MRRMAAIVGVASLMLSLSACGGNGGSAASTTGGVVTQSPGSVRKTSPSDVEPASETPGGITHTASPSDAGGGNRPLGGPQKSPEAVDFGTVGDLHVLSCGQLLKFMDADRGRTLREILRPLLEAKGRSVTDPESVARDLNTLQAHCENPANADQPVMDGLN